MRPAAKVRALNAWIRDHARMRGTIRLDCSAAMSDPEGGLERAWPRTTCIRHLPVAPLAQASALRKQGLRHKEPVIRRIDRPIMMRPTVWTTVLKFHAFPDAAAKRAMQ